MLKLTQIFIIFYSFYSIYGSKSNSTLSSAPASRIDPLVSTSAGLIRGLTSEDGSYSQFLGIPYGLVDEENPFSPSTPHPHFNEPLNAYDGSVICPQADRQDNSQGQIQCLNLNVYVPNAAYSQNRMPVMVYIHGGAFIEGSGTDPLGSFKYLIQKEVIVVSINYRLGIYGFICTDSPKAPGNIGLKDQLIALRWVKEHIESFGGDKDKITVFGESAGAMSVHLQLLSPHEKVFDQAIIQSGPATSPWTMEATNNNVPIEIANRLGMSTEDLDEAIDFIAKTNVDLVVFAGNLLKKASQYSSEPFTKACVEKEFEGIERFVLENPNVVKLDKAKTIPIIIGYTSQELIFQHGDKEPEFFSNYSFEDLLSFGLNVTDFDEMLNLVKHFYIGDDAPSKTLENELTSFASDFVFNHPTKRAIKLLLDSDAVVYHYVFSYVGGLSTMEEMNTTIAGAAHADDIMYLFGIGEPDIISDEDKITIDRLATMWTNFAKYGEPIPDTSELLPVKWEPVSKQTTPYLSIDKDLSIKHGPFHGRMAFWDLFYKFNEAKTNWHTKKEDF